MNIALIFAGGVGARMNLKSRPKQFLELHGKAIIIYTLEVFDCHPNIDKILVVCVEEWISYLEELIRRAGLQKVVKIVPGGKNTQESQYLGLKEIASWQGVDERTIVLIHDGVRPLVDSETIDRNIDAVKQFGSAITVTSAIETIIYVDGKECLNDVLDRKKCRMAKAPQSYYLFEIYEMYMRAAEQGREEYIDSACLMQDFGKNLHTVEGNDDNIKITTPKDYYLFKAIVEAKENSLIWGI